MDAGPSASTIVTVLDDDALECIVRAIWQDRKGNLTIVGFLIARAWRATCKTFLAASKRCTTPWDGVVSRWVPLDDLPDRMVKHGYDECHVRQSGCNGMIPHSFEGGHLMGRIYVNENGAQDDEYLNWMTIDERHERALDPFGLKYNKRTSGFLTILRDRTTDRIMILNIHGDAFETDSNLGDNFAFDVWDMPQCVRMFCVQSADRMDQVPMMAQAVSGSAHKYNSTCVGRTHTRSLPMIRFVRPVYDGAVDFAQHEPIAALAPVFWIYTGKMNRFQFHPLERPEGKHVRTGVGTNRLVFEDMEFLRIRPMNFLSYCTRPDLKERSTPGFLNWPGLPLNAVPPLMTVCGHHETPHRLNACLADLLHRRTWDMPAALRTAGMVDLDRRIQEEGRFARLKQQVVLEKDEDAARATKAKAPTSIVVAMESDDEDAPKPPPQPPASKRPCTRRDAGVRAKIASTMEADGNTYESGRMLASMNDEPANSGYVDDQYAVKEKEQEEMDRTVEYEEIEASKDDDWGATRTEQVSPGAREKKIIPAISDDEEEEHESPHVPMMTDPTLEELEQRHAASTAEFGALLAQHDLYMRAMQAKWGAGAA